jgi:hypothetical protein
MADPFVPCVPECNLKSCPELGCWAEDQLDLTPRGTNPDDAELARDVVRQLVREVVRHRAECREPSCHHFAHKRWR